MITRIHPEITKTPEYNPFDDEKVIDLGPNDRMTVKQTLIVTNQLDLKNVVTIGESKSGGIICTYSEMSQEKTLFMLEKMKSWILSGVIHEPSGNNTEET